MNLITPVCTALVWMLVILSARSLPRGLMVVLGLLFVVIGWMISSSGWGPLVGFSTVGVTVVGLSVALWRRQVVERAWHERLASFGLPADTPGVELTLDGFAGEAGARKAWLSRYGATVWLIPSDASIPAFHAPHNGYLINPTPQGQLILIVPSSPPTPLVVTLATTEVTELVRLRNRISSLIS